MSVNPEQDGGKLIQSIVTIFTWLDKQAGLEHVFDLPRKDFRVPKMPTQCRRKQRQIKYSFFLKSVNAIRALGTLPVVLTFGEDMTVDEWVQNWGSWHKSCYVKFSKEKLERATKKRDRNDAVESTTLEKRPRRQSMDRMACLFCHKED